MEKIPVFSPHIGEDTKQHLNHALDDGWLGMGSKTMEFEREISKVLELKNRYVVTTNTGTSALHIALKLAGVKSKDEVITQSLTFVATCNAIRYCGAKPVFVDVNKTTLGISPQSLQTFLEDYCELRNDGFCWNKSTNRRVIACLPMHTFGFPVELDEIIKICKLYKESYNQETKQCLP